jgi:hypothetical protein
MDSLIILKKRNNQDANSGAVIIPVASGKGGVGKTFIAANLALALAERGHRVVAVDLDFGGANLHSLLGISNRHAGIGDFLKARTAELEDLLVPAGAPNLSFLPGDGKTPFMANIAYAQKIKLMVRIRKLPADFILLDLGAGSSLGGIEIKVDEWGIDACFSCSQKCIGCAAGLSPITFSDRAVETVKKRKIPVNSWYLDISLIEKYWGTERVYHHTSSSTLNYGLLEALLLIHEEGLEKRFARHLKNHKALVAGVEALGLKMLVSPEYRLPTLNTVLIPEGVDDVKLRRYLLEKFKLDIGGGFGRLKGKVWRVGLMGYSSSADNVLFFIPAISRALALQGFKTDLAAGLDAVLTELDGNGNNVVELKEKAAAAAL